MKQYEVIVPIGNLEDGKKGVVDLGEGWVA